MNEERLIKLAQVLDRRGKKTGNLLNMNKWLERFQPEGERTPCNTAGCALGVATAIPEFRKAGLIGVTPTMGPHIRYGDFTGYSAATKFFEISYCDATHLFAPMNYVHAGEVSPRTVASRIRRFVKKGQA